MKSKASYWIVGAALILIVSKGVFAESTISPVVMSPYTETRPDACRIEAQVQVSGSQDSLRKPDASDGLSGPLCMDIAYAETKDGKTDRQGSNLHRLIVWLRVHCGRIQSNWCQF